MKAIATAMALLCGFVMCSLWGEASTPRIPKPFRGFERNIGQFRDENGRPLTSVDVGLRLSEGTMTFHPTGYHVGLHQVRRWGRFPNDSIETAAYRMDVHYVGANASARFEALDVQASYARYLLPGIASHAVASHMKRFRYRDVWNGIDVLVDGATNGAKVDYIVHPGANPASILIRYEGATAITVQHGALVVSNPLGTVTEERPVAWTEKNGQRRHVDVRFHVEGEFVRFDVGEYDPTATLTIDPKITFSTYYTGNGAVSDVSTAVDRLGNIYMAGTTLATNLPARTSSGVVQRNKAGGRDVNSDGFVTKFDEFGGHIWSTYYGSTAADNIADIVVDSTLNIYTIGSSRGDDHPLILIENDATVRKVDVMLLALTSSGGWLDSRLFGGTEDDFGVSLDVRDSLITMGGTTSSPSILSLFGSPYAMQDPIQKRFDVFLIRAKKSRPTDFTWFTYFGGTESDELVKLKTDATHNVYLLAQSNSSNLVSTTPVVTKSPLSDALVFSFSATGQRRWATFYGGSTFDFPFGLDVDATASPIIVGRTFSSDIPVTGGRPAFRGREAGFIAKFAGGTGARQWSQCVVGDTAVGLLTVSVTPSNDIWVGGSATRCTDFAPGHTADAFQPTVQQPAAGEDGFVRRYAANGDLEFSSYLAADNGGDFGSDRVFSLSADADAYLIAGIQLETRQFTTTPGAFLTPLTWETDINVIHSALSHINFCDDSVITITTPGPTSICDGESLELRAPTGFVRYLWNTGATSRTITVSDTGRYVVIVTTQQGCRYRVTMDVARNPKPTVSAGADVIACGDSITVLQASPLTGTAPYRYKWNRVEPGPEFIDNDTSRTPAVNPTSTSRYAVTMTDGGGCVAVDTVLVTIRSPQPTALRDTVDFGTLDACASSAEQDIVIRNPESYPVRLAAITSTIPGVAATTDVTAVTIAAGGTATVRLRYTATAAGSQTGTITVAGTPCQWRVIVQARADKAALVATVVPSVVNFPTSVSCQTEPFLDTIVVRNGTPSPMTISFVRPGSPFDVLSPNDGTQVPANGEQEVVVRYAPAGTGLFTDRLLIPFTAGSCSDTLRVTLNGRRENVSVSASAESITMPILLGCELSRDTVVTLVNGSTVPVTISIPSDPQLAITPAGPTITIPAGEQRELAISVRPSQTGPYSIVARFGVQPCDREIGVTISGSKQGISFTVPSLVNLGEVSSCTPGRMAVATASLTFAGSASQGTVTSVTTGPNVSTTLTQGTVLVDGVAVPFDIRWTPTVDGELIDSVVLQLSPCDERRVIRVIGSRTSVRLSTATPTIALGNLTAPATGTIEFSNTGTDTVTVGVVSRSTTAFVVSQSPDPLTPILPGQRVSVEYRIVCGGREATRDVLEATTLQPCTSSDSVVFTGTCIAGGPSATATVSIDSVQMTIGERRTIPIRLVASSGLTASGATSWRASIRYRTSVLVGSGQTPDCWTAQGGETCIIDITGTRGGDTTGQLAALDMTAVLGDTNVSDLTLESFSWTTAPSVTTTRIHGHVTITDICRDGDGPRYLVRGTAQALLVPNPASESVAITIPGMARNSALTIDIASIVGETLVAGRIAPNAVLDVTDLAAGTYLIRTTANGQPVSAILTITR